MYCAHLEYPLLMTKAYSDSAMQCLAKDAGYEWELVLGYVDSRKMGAVGAWYMDTA